MSTVAVTAFAMVLLTLLVQLVLAGVNDRGVDTVLEDRADAVTSTIEGVVASGGALSPATLELDPGVVVFDAAGRRVAGVAAAGEGGPVRALASASRARYLDGPGDVRLLAEPFDAGGGGVVVLSEPLAPYERAETYALVASIAAGAVVTAGAGGVAAWVMRRALSPVAQMAARADDWSEHDLGRRFELGEPRNEISTLGATLDHLLDRVARTIGAEQRLTSELAHELRTPLTTVQATAQLVLMRDDLDPSVRSEVEQMERSCHQMGQTISTLLDLARTGRGAASDSVAVTALLRATVDARADTGTRVVVEVEDDRLRVALPEALATRALGPVLDNALRYATQEVRLTAHADGEHAVVVVTDDGPGLPDHDVDLFEPGVAVGDRGGTGLGLALARRVARAGGGDVVARPGDHTGARIEVRLPAVST
ncbi:sensor histidine kinase [Solicola sp. PLA-1-18]|uniref:sensor histidine kinase n=1 Tax=Solicola sp. PLA-1-18 TaxID=3380532 RepID=UPI003B7F2A46